MYIIRLDKNQGKMYKEVYNFEGFRITDNIQEATRFKTSAEAQKILQSPAISNVYQEAQIERIR
jgi:hypothetical protein